MCPPSPFPSSRESAGADDLDVTLSSWLRFVLRVGRILRACSKCGLRYSSTRPTRPSRPARALFVLLDVQQEKDSPSVNHTTPVPNVPLGGQRGR